MSAFIQNFQIVQNQAGCLPADNYWILHVISRLGLSCMTAGGKCHACLTLGQALRCWIGPMFKFSCACGPTFCNWSKCLSRQCIPVAITDEDFAADEQQQGLIPVMILDELDSGVGARLGTVMGRLLQRLAATSVSQLICVTHLAQVCEPLQTKNSYRPAKR